MTNQKPTISFTQAQAMFGLTRGRLQDILWQLDILSTKIFVKKLKRWRAYYTKNEIKRVKEYVKISNVQRGAG